MYCKYCGKEIEDSAKFCNYCGKEVNSSRILTGGHNVKNTVEKNLEIKDIEKNIKQYLEQKDGKTHVLLVDTFILEALQDIEKVYNPKLNKILKIMQSNNYDIIDIKLTKSRGTGYTTLIIYK